MFPSQTTHITPTVEKKVGVLNRSVENVERLLHDIDQSLNRIEMATVRLGHSPVPMDGSTAHGAVDNHQPQPHEPSSPKVEDLIDRLREHAKLLDNRALASAEYLEHLVS